MIIGSALFMQMLDSTVIANALPTMARSLHEDPLTLNVAITTYLLASAVFLPISGWAADRFGARRVFSLAIAIFAISSMACGLSQNLAELVGARLVQGMAGAMMAPVGRLVLLRSVPKSELVRAMTWLTVPVMLGPILGPPLGASSSPSRPGDGYSSSTSRSACSASCWCGCSSATCARRTRRRSTGAASC